MPLEEASAFGVMAVDAQWRITEFAEKPEHPQPLPGNPERALASMGIYIFNSRMLFEELARDSHATDSTHDFGRDIIPSIIRRCNVFAYPFRDPQTGAQAYWRDVGTVDSFWQANMELIGITPELNLYDHDWPIWTYQEQLPPAKFVFDDDDRRGTAIDSIVAGGCIVSGSVVRRSLLFSNVRVNSYSTIEDSVVLPDVEIGRHVILRRCVIDKGVVIPEGTTIGVDPAADRRRFHVTERGVTLVTPDMLGQSLHRIA